MKDPRPKVARLCLFQGESEKIEQAIIRIEKVPVRSINAHILRHDIDEPPQLLFRHFPLFDVRPGQVPTSGEPLFVVEWFGAHQKPAILSVFSSQTYFHLPWLSPYHPGLALAAVFLQVLRMKALCRSVLKEKLLQGQAVIIQHSLIGVKTPSILIKHDDVLWNRIHELPKLLLPLQARFDSLRSLVSLTDVRTIHINVIKL